YFFFLFYRLVQVTWPSIDPAYQRLPIIFGIMLAAKGRAGPVTTKRHVQGNTDIDCFLTLPQRIHVLALIIGERQCERPRDLAQEAWVTACCLDDEDAEGADEYRLAPKWVQVRQDRLKLCRRDRVSGFQCPLELAECFLKFDRFCCDSTNIGCGGPVFF